MTFTKIAFKLLLRNVTITRAINVVLLWAGLATLYAWLSGHMLPYLMQTRLVGGTVALWSLLELVPKVFAKPDDKEKILSRILNRPETIVYLLAILAMSLVLYYNTSSVYIRYDNPAANESNFYVEFEDVETGARLSEQMSLSHYQDMVGMPFLFRDDSQRLRIKIYSENFYRPRDTVLRAGTSLRLDVPGKFTRKPLNLIRVIPGSSLYSRLPFSRDNKAKPYLIEIQIGDTTSVRDTIIQQDIFFGAVSRELYWGIRMLESEELRNYAAWYYESRGYEQRAGMLAAQTLEVNRKILDSIPISSGDEVRITIYLEGENGQLTPKVSKVVTMESTDVMTVIMEIREEEQYEEDPKP